ncbi:MAG: alcohol dehydrogenase catalytic domain-containing protein [Fimbriimonadales bacterium]|nr:alcohol dehydrogenase catalytic domain-containing protein [Fimbriimonadales bacterium]
MSPAPTTQHAIQLVGPDQIRLNEAKPVPRPKGRQILAKVEAVGLCFSDLKLLHQFDRHVRKAEVVSGIEPEVLAALPSYVPGERPTVPGHEAVLRIAAVGEDVRWYRCNERYIVQADFRRLKVPTANGAFGYNFEGALQEYTLLDERIVGDPRDPDSYLLPAPDGPSASSLALVEPWACVENSYSNPERRRPLSSGRLLLFGAGIEDRRRVLELYDRGPELVAEARTLDALAALPDQAFDDAVLFRPTPEAVELVSDKLADGGIANLVLAGAKLGRPCTIGIGRVHYGGCRWVGTTGEHPAEGYAWIPQTGELRQAERMLVVGAGGPMGQMHVLRSLMAGVGASVVAADVDANRLAALGRKARRFQGFLPVDASREDVGRGFTYAAIMAPVPELVADALERCAEGAIVNVFAGIPVGVKHPFDCDRIVQSRIFVFGTSGSETRDMRSVLAKVLDGRLDTDASVAAVSGMAGAEAGLRAVEDRSIEGKIVVYPSARGLGLTPLADLHGVCPEAARSLRDGDWCLEAESALLRCLAGA